MHSPLRILHLEDDRHDAEIVKAVLEAGGIVCDVARVESRNEFVAALDQDFDLVLADLSLPTFDGLAALQITLERRPELPFIFVSGTLGEEVAIDALKIGATDYILKERLSRIVNSVHRATRECRERAERREAEERLRRSEEFLAEGQRISHTGSWVWTLSSGKLVWSEEQYRVLGFEPGRVEPAMDVFMTIVHPEDRQAVRQYLEETRRSKQPYAMDYRIVLADGTIRHLRGVGRPVENGAGEVEEFIGTTTDVTERVQADAALVARQQMLDLAQKAAQAVPFEWRIGPGAGGRAGPVDGGSSTGQSPTATVPRESWREHVHAEDWPILELAIARATADSGDFSAEYRAARREDGVRWLQAKGHMFLDDQGAPLRIVGFLLDVTERHRAEDELRRLEARLRRARHLEAIGALAGGIAHDFNNILGAILGYGEIAMRDAAPGSRLRHAIENVVVAGERGRSLVNRILAFSRSGVGERVAVRVESVVRETLDLIIAQLPGGIAIETALQAGLSAIQGDPTQVHQLLMNLATNAIYAMPTGGTLRVSLSTVRVDVPRIAMIGVVEAGDYVVLQVGDTGGGIAADLVERIFDPFVTTKEVGVGTGLGLSLVHGIVMDLGGAIEVETAIGVGSTFAIHLPRTGDVTDPYENEELELPRGNGQHVLVVDDEEALARLVEQNLLDLGYLPEAFVSSEAALKAFAADPRRYQAVVSDERMPGLPGISLLRRIRAIDPAIATLLVSGYVNAEVIERARLAGVDQVVKKPMSARDLATMLARALQERGGMRAAGQ